METLESLNARTDAAVAAASARMERLRAAEAYAGENPMAHYAGTGITKPGHDGAEQMFARLLSAELPKFKAGEALVRARTNRALGNIKGARLALTRAMEWRRLAQLRAAR